MPIIGKNLEQQKNKYNGREREVFVIARGYHSANGAENERSEESVNDYSSRGQGSEISKPRANRDVIEIQSRATKKEVASRLSIHIVR